MKEERQAKFLSRSASQRGVRARESESERERGVRKYAQGFRVCRKLSARPTSRVCQLYVRVAVRCACRGDCLGGAGNGERMRCAPQAKLRGLLRPILT